MKVTVERGIVKPQGLWVSLDRDGIPTLEVTAEGTTVRVQFENAKEADETALAIVGARAIADYVRTQSAPVVVDANGAAASPLRVVKS